MKTKKVSWWAGRLSQHALDKRYTWRQEPRIWWPQTRCTHCQSIHPVLNIAMPPGLGPINMFSSLLGDLSERGVLSGYQKFVVGLEPILKDMSERGVPVSPERWAAVRAELERDYAATEASMQALVPDEVKPFHPKNGYKRPPVMDEGEGDGTYLLKKFEDGDERWVKLDPWKPSLAGLVRYMKHRGHPVPKDWKSDKETTNEQELERLANRTKDPLYDCVLSYRQIGTILNNHIPNWEPDAGGRVHPVFYYEPGTGQLASRRPNAQNAPKHGKGSKKELADAFRSMIQPRKGHTLLEFDYRSFHAQTLAFEAGDADYLRLAKLDIHSYLTAHLVRHPERHRLLGLSDDELADRLGEIKEAHGFVRDYKAKRAILGYGFGMGWKKLYMMNRESFDSQADAKRVVDMLNGLFPKACAWRDAVRKQAHEQGYLLSRFGCIRWFWEVLRWQGGEWRSGGDDSEAAVAFLPANDAFCHIKEAMLRLDRAPVMCGAGAVRDGSLLKKYGLINQIHDALMFECPDELVDEALAAVPEEMERPSLVLVSDICPGGLSVEVSASRSSENWSKMEKVKCLRKNETVIA